MTRQGEREFEQIKKNHKDWLDSIPVEDIYVANLARNSLRRFEKKAATNLQDDRLPRRPTSAYNAFVTRETQGTTGGLNKDVSANWNSLSQSEKNALAPNYAREMEEFKKQLDVIREMAKLKIRQSKSVTPEVEKQV